MKNRLFVIPVLAAIFGATVALTADEDVKETPSFSKEQVEFFEKDVLPILRQNCFKCHGGEPKLKGGFRLTSREGLVKGGELGPAIDVKKPQDSELLAAINYDGREMPQAANCQPRKSRP